MTNPFTVVSQLNSPSHAQDTLHFDLQSAGFILLRCFPDTRWCIEIVLPVIEQIADNQMRIRLFHEDGEAKNRFPKVADIFADHGRKDAKTFRSGKVRSGIFDITSSCERHHSQLMRKIAVTPDCGY
ncbi:hypothetical protein L596_001802 [Steinernema carpocapsae]|uniref:Uncharacterized protein n=1 Tax=Steinernema carpocapsae TaxID=34508 RepID=A0A4U8UMK0_STECR|nr:hypothetical protein L596_001802 [Steinernema carpocapsae]